jgi:hypothetical protein
MRCDFQGIKLRVIASLITLYTIGFICHVAWSGYQSSVTQPAGLKMSDWFSLLMFIMYNCNNTLLMKQV